MDSRTLQTNNIPRTIAIIIYVLYLCTVFIPPLCIIGVVFAYVFENDATDYLKSHYTYLIRTFWIGLLYFTISIILISILIGIILVIVSAVWWLIRVTKGLKDILQNNPIVNSQTWKF